MNSAKCCICGRPLSNPYSIDRGMGEVCAAKFGLFTRNAQSRRAPTGPDFSFFVIDIAGHDVGIVIDHDNGRSVTNSIDFVAGRVGVHDLIYRDTEGTWDYWNPFKGFQTLAINGKRTIDMDEAVSVTRQRYFAQIGGLFA